jgi:outer membrane protein OmpA-like peptidoglycan-associated protein/tetratricopeptide (TPR) repeat protein
MKRVYRHTTKWVLSFCMIVAATTAFSQTTNDYLKAAEDFFSKGDYYSAARNYERVLSGKIDTMGAQFNPYVMQRTTPPKAKMPTGSSRHQIVYKVAESYRLLNNPVQSEPYYQEAVSYGAEYPLARFYYAQSLKANAKFDDAEREFNQFINETSDAQAKADAQKELQNLAFISAQLKKRDLKYYTVNKLGANINPHGANYAPALMDKMLVFTSTRKDSNDKKAPYINRLYWTTVDDNGTSVQLVDVKQDKDYHQGVSTFTPDGSMMFLTKWHGKSVSQVAQIYMSTKKGDKWSDPVLVSGDINVAGYSSQEPSVSPDGKFLYYSSNKPGGAGRFDIWVAPIDNGIIGASTNIGGPVNSADDERAPYYYQQGKSLIFSTDGRIGMGGYDFFESKGMAGAWSAPVNLGYPVNSIKNDMYLVSTGEKNILDNVYLSSDRASECCYEMFALNKIRPKRTISGLIVDCADNAPLGNVNVDFIDAKGTTVSTKKTDANGRYEIILDEYQPLRAVASREGYHSKELSFNAPADDFDETMTNPSLCIDKIPPPPIEVNKPIVMENVYYDFNKATLKPESYPSLDSLVSLLNFYPKMIIEISAHTDNKGSDKYNMTLSEKRAKSVVDYLISKGIDASRLQSKGYGESMPIAPNTLENGKDNPEGRAKNRRTEFKVLSY